MQKLRARRDAENGRYGGRKLCRNLFVFGRERSCIEVTSCADTTLRREMMSRVRHSISHNVPQSCPIMQQTRITNSWIRNLFIIHLLLKVRPCKSPSTGGFSRLSHSLCDSYPMSTDKYADLQGDCSAYLRAIIRPICKNM